MGNCLTFCIPRVSVISDHYHQFFSGPNLNLEQEAFLDQSTARQNLPERLYSQEEFDVFMHRISRLLKLPIETYVPGDGTAEEKTQECVICLLDFVHGDKIRILPCKHFFHLDCIRKWLVTSLTCPYCRQPV